MAGTEYLVGPLVLGSGPYVIISSEYTKLHLFDSNAFRMRTVIDFCPSVKRRGIGNSSTFIGAKAKRQQLDHSLPQLLFGYTTYNQKYGGV